MNRSPSSRGVQGRWLIALSTLLLAPACGREDDPASPPGGAGGLDFSKVSVEDPSQVAGALRELGIDPPVDEPVSLQRGASSLPAHLLWPLGEVRREGLTSVRVDLDLAVFASTGEDSATLRFRDGSTVLSQESISTNAWSVVKPLPAAVLDAAKKGNVITWGLVLADRKSKPIEGTFKVIEKAQATRKLTELADDKRLARTPLLLGLAKAQVLENYTLLAEALPLYVELTGNEALKKTGFAGVARCLQRLGSHQKQLALRESELYRLALEQMTPQKGSGGAPTPTGPGSSAGGPGGAGGGIGETPEPTASAGGTKPIPTPGGSTPGSGTGTKPVGAGGSMPPGAGGPMATGPNAQPGTPPVEPSASADDALMVRAVQVLAQHAERLKERAAADSHGLERAREKAEHAKQQALASRQAADAAQKRLDDAMAARGQPVPGTDPAPVDKDKLKALKEAADAARAQADADEVKAQAAEAMVRQAADKEAASRAAAREQQDALRHMGRGMAGTPPGGEPSVPAPGTVPPVGPPVGTPGSPAPVLPTAPVTPTQLQELMAAVAKGQASAESSLKDANDALDAAILARGADPSPANVQAVKDARAQVAQAQKALDEANAVAERLRRAADAAGTPPR